MAITGYKIWLHNYKTANSYLGSSVNGIQYRATRCVLDQRGESAHKKSTLLSYGAVVTSRCKIKKIQCIVYTCWQICKSRGYRPAHSCSLLDQRLNYNKKYASLIKLLHIIITVTGVHEIQIKFAKVLQLFCWPWPLSSLAYPIINHVSTHLW